MFVARFILKWTLLHIRCNWFFAGVLFASVSTTAFADEHDEVTDKTAVYLATLPTFEIMATMVQQNPPSAGKERVEAVEYGESKNGKWVVRGVVPDGKTIDSFTPAIAYGFNDTYGFLLRRDPDSKAWVVSKAGSECRAEIQQQVELQDQFAQINTFRGFDHPKLISLAEAVVSDIEYDGRMATKYSFPIKATEKSPAVRAEVVVDKRSGVFVKTLATSTSDVWSVIRRFQWSGDVILPDESDFQIRSLDNELRYQRKTKIISVKLPEDVVDRSSISAFGISERVVDIK